MDDDAERLEREVAALELDPAGAVGGADPWLVGLRRGSVLARGRPGR